MPLEKYKKKILSRVARGGTRYIDPRRVPRCEYHSYVLSILSTSDANFDTFGLPKISQVLEALSDVIPRGNRGIFSLLDTKTH